MDEVRARFGAALRDWRVRRKLTQEALAERSGLSYKFVGEVERGKGNPTLTTISKLAKALEIGPAELFATADRSRVAFTDFRITKGDLQVVREAAESIGALVASIASPEYRTRRRRKH